jgi:hypothetical protein
VNSAPAIMAMAALLAAARAATQTVFIRAGIANEVKKAQE